MAGKCSFAVSEEEPSRQFMLIENSSVVMSAYLERNVAETFDGNGQRLCLTNSSIVMNITLTEIKRGLSAATGNAFTSQNPLG